MVRVDRYVVKIGKFGAYFYDQDERKELSLDEVVAIMNKNAEPPKLTVSTNIPFEPIESNGMPLQPILAVQEDHPRNTFNNEWVRSHKESDEL
jgi:hypothetical protein